VFLNKYDDAKGFVVAFGAVNSRLVEVDAQTHEYRAETDQAFLKYEYDAAYGTDGLWTVTDKSGNKFYFGQVPGESPGTVAGAVMRHPQFTSSAEGDNVFLWALAKIQDINGNLTYVYYTENNGQVYLDEIRYSGHTQNLPTTGSVRFLPDSTERSDKSISYATGYRVETNKRLSRIDVLVYDYGLTAWTRVRQYRLEYEQSPSTLRSLLRSVKMCGTGDPNLPASYLPPVTSNTSRSRSNSTPRSTGVLWTARARPPRHGTARRQQAQTSPTITYISRAGLRGRKMYHITTTRHMWHSAISMGILCRIES